MHAMVSSSLSVFPFHHSSFLYFVKPSQSVFFFFLLLQHSDINTFQVISAQDWDEVASLSLVSAFRVTELNGAFWPYFRLPLSSSKIDLCQMPGNTIEKMIHPVILIMLLWAKYNWVSQLILLSTPWNIVISSIEFWYAGQAILGLTKLCLSFSSVEMTGMCLPLENYDNSINKLKKEIYDLDYYVSSPLYVMICALSISHNRMPFIYFHIKWQ